jgi:hypothetical protein
MLKVFISQPMAGRSDDEILAMREYVKAYLRRVLPIETRKPEDKDFEVIDSFFKGTHDKPLACLADSIALLAEADLAAFAPGWENAKGCVIERKCCFNYGVRAIEVQP